jgi:hypothetical protein
MAFRKFGGLNYAATNNIVRNHFSNNDNPTISNQLGDINSKIVCASHLDMSLNSILNISALYFSDGTVQTTAYTGGGGVGPQGPQGNPGSVGPTGPAGPTGLQGSTGPAGPTGLQGSTGPVGPTGSQGNQGTQGSQGNQGSQGSQGNQGNQGYQGSQGYQGDIGSTGLQGNQGNQGYQGYQGDIGPTGSQGYQGYQGDIGPQGYQGIPGMTSYTADISTLGGITSSFTTVVPSLAPPGSIIVMGMLTIMGDNVDLSTYSYSAIIYADLIISPNIVTTSTPNNLNIQVTGLASIEASTTNSNTCQYGCINWTILMVI